MTEMNAYVRVSTVDQVQGSSLDAQRLTCLRMGREVQEKHGAVWGSQKHGDLWDDPGFFCDSGVSAFKVPFFDRPGAAACCNNLRRGDFLIVARLDRTFRSVGDFQTTWKVLQEHGVTLLSCQPVIDPTTPHGMAMMQSLVVFFQWESAIKSQRQRESAAVRKRKAEGEQIKIEVKSESKYTKDHQQKLSLMLSEPVDGVRWLPSDAAPPLKRIIRPEDLHGRCLEYIRNSHVDAHSAGLGLDNQRQIARGWSERLMEMRPNVTGTPHVFYDDTVSAFKIPFFERPAGKALMDFARPGDHIVFSRLDRGFRSVVDCLWTVDQMRKRGITVHFADMQFDCSDPINRAFLAQGAIFCELESAFTAQRTRDGVGVSRQKRGFHTKIPRARKVESEIVAENGKRIEQRRLTWDRRKLAIRRWFIHLFYWEELSLPECWKRMEGVMCKREGRPRPCPMSGVSPGHAVRFGLRQNGRQLIVPAWCKGTPFRVIGNRNDKEGSESVLQWYVSRGLSAPDIANSPRVKRAGHVPKRVREFNEAQAQRVPPQDILVF